jgi:cytoskeletal protein RodZ
MGRGASRKSLYQNFTVIQDQGSVGIGSQELFQNESSDAVPENNDARVVSADAIGAYLRERRLIRNVGLEEVSEATGISAGVLKILESDDREQFPAEIYIKAFYKKYAAYLELNPEEILSAYLQQSQKKSKKGGRFNFGTVVTLKRKGESLFIEITRRLFVPVIVILGGYLLYWIYNNYMVFFNPSDFFK